jgi:hypothetical protein
MCKKRSLLFTGHLLCLIFAAIYLSGCFNHDADSEVPQTLLTLDPLTIPYMTPDHWVYATDANGHILDIKKTIGREQLILSSVRRVDKFNLNIVSASADTNGKTYLKIQTYANVETGSTFDIRHATGGLVLRDPGAVTFKINGYDGPEHGILFTNRGSYLDYEEKIEGGSFNANIQMCRLPSDVLLTTYRDGTPVYAKITDVKDGDILELDINKNFTPFEHQRKLDFKGYSNNGWVLGAYLDDNRDPELPFHLIDSYRLSGTKDETDQPVIGYIDGFDIYHMFVSNSQPSGHVSYNMQGKIADSFASFTMPTFTYRTVNTDLRHFTFQFSEEFTYYSAYFNSESAVASMAWSIHAPKGIEVNIGDVPAEILTAYPMVQPEAFEYSGCSLTKVISGGSYRQNILRIGPSASEFEYYTFSPNP